MAKVKGGITGGFVKAESKPKKTSDGSRRTRNAVLKHIEGRVTDG